MNVYLSKNYKEIIKLRVKELRSRKRPWTFRRLSDSLGIQATYFSKVLNHKDVHLGEEDLFKITQALEFMPKETNYILLLRSLEIAKTPARRDFLSHQIDQYQIENKLNSEDIMINNTAFENQMAYLLNPLCVVLYVALTSGSLRKDLKLIAYHLGIKQQQLKDLIQILERNLLLETDRSDLFKVTKVHTRRMHFQKDHPLMRIHQQLFKALIDGKINLVPEEEKVSQMYTFTLDPIGFEKIKSEYKKFLKRVEVISEEARDNEVYQLNFDFFKWF
ncbi:MAG TPA: TIGR02147 family protein [Pseudobdellovibrionaceae bacterium]|nr:TIGR02147 family protein [Pseudobdellovibrionaceae bacterium]